LFLTVMVIGLVGLVMMAIPALFGHGHPGHHHLPLSQGHGHAHLPGITHGHHGAHPAELPPAQAGVGADKLIVATAAHGGFRFIPSPRAVFSLCALYGASGNALVHAGHLSPGVAAVVAIAPALLVERLLIRPVWNLMFRFKAEASSPLEQLILAEAQAVVPFRNGRGLITTIRDGRQVQLSAQLREQDATTPVNFGQRLRIEDVDARRERVTVSLVANDKPSNNPT
jgi:hypothetical protein